MRWGREAAGGGRTWNRGSTELAEVRYTPMDADGEVENGEWRMEKGCTEREVEFDPRLAPGAG